jgi:hypothetical protein
MNWTLFIQLTATAFVAVMASWLSHRFSSERDVANERRKMRIQYLLDAYRRLESASNRPNIDGDWSKFESAVADVQLLGGAQQVRLAREFALNMAKNGTAPLDPLIEDLRASLRSELLLEAVRENVVYVRLTSTKPVL